MNKGKRPQKQVSKKCKNDECIQLTPPIVANFWEKKFCTLHCYNHHLAHRGSCIQEALPCSNSLCEKTIPFNPSINNDFVYCSVECKKIVRKERKHIETTVTIISPDPIIKENKHPVKVADHNVTAICPFPHKKEFTQPKDAWGWIDDNHPKDKFISAYRCVCGAIHIGHTVTKRENIITRNS